MTTANELRQQYLEYFIARDHRKVSSSPIVPPDDPTMLFTSAGMVQFKPLWAGDVEPLPYVRATTVQKCLRAGGKDSDLENVGKTLRHHTFFEMLGNFSFGDYFKREALEWGWDFVRNVMHLPPERLWATTFEQDDEAPRILEEDLGFSRDRIIPLNAKENFWGPAGDSGACGPCSEIIFFTGSEQQLREAMQQDPATIARRIVAEGDLFLEIWNMVFPQFDQQPDGSRLPLKYRGIDTGAGFERMTTAIQFIETGGRIRTSYETDLLQNIVQAAASCFGKIYRCLADQGGEASEETFFLNAISDHARALTFALGEGIVPSNEGRGYVLRRILRRALRFGYLMGRDEPFLHALVQPVVDTMGGIYPEIVRPAPHVSQVIRQEEERFLRTVAQGSKILDEVIERTKDAGESAVRGEDAFLLHATYGFPVDMTAEIAEDAGLGLDRAGFAEAMRGHQEQARKSWKGAALDREADLVDDIFERSGETGFHGYEALSRDVRVVGLIREGQRVERLNEGEDGVVILSETPFYAESGGQVGDHGALEGDAGLFRVCDTQKTPNGIVLHRGGIARGAISVGDALTARVDEVRRNAVMSNHTVTHLLQAALKRVVGEHVTQAGSYVGPEGMRFDFNHTQACTAEQLREVERLVNGWILCNESVRVEVLPIEEARGRGAIAPFGEKYGHVVRIVQIGETSMEFCGGTHLDRISRIGSFRLVSESSVASGVRRIEGVTGMQAYEAWAGSRDTVDSICRALSAREETLPERVGDLQEEIKQLRREIKRLKQSKPGISADSLLADAKDVQGLRLVAAKIADAEPDQLRALADQLRDKSEGLVCVLGSAAGGKVSLLCAVSPDATGWIQAGSIIKQVAAIVGGGGGGRPDLAQAGGRNPEKLDEAIARAEAIVASLLKS